MNNIRLAALLPIFTVFLILVPPGLAAADNPDVVEAFRKNYTRGSLSTKVRVLQDSIEYEDTDMSPLYLLSLDFVIDNAWMLAGDNTGRELITFSVRLAGINRIGEAAEKLWSFFRKSEDPAIRLEIMSALGDTAAGNTSVINGINDWLRLQNTAFRSGEPVNTDIVAEAVASLGRLGSPSSFPVVFTASTLGYGGRVSANASEAMGNIDGYFTDHIIQVIQNSEVSEKLAALKAAYGQDRLSREDKAAIAENALDIALYSVTSDQQEENTMRELRFEAVRELTELNWSGLSENLIKHFDITVFEWEQKLCGRQELIEAVNALGGAGTHDAAVRLTLYLEVLNTYTENGQVVDEQLILEVIRNLGELGDSVAFDYLLYTGYLNYSGTVQRAAREALENLKRL